MTAGEVLREARRRSGLSQRRLAVRAGTSQDAISRIERGSEVPSVERLERILLALGEKLTLEVTPVRPAQLDSLSPAERLRESASWNLAATTFELAGVEARRRGDPATRRSERDA